ncbi:hypothetical protein ACSNN5_18165 [Brevibacillus formosus]|uniref:hypothetical protein n=1 Tax=Brevibacillus formosus TaxID=54913 RepID=UPI003F1DD588
MGPSSCLPELAEIAKIGFLTGNPSLVEHDQMKAGCGRPNPQPGHRYSQCPIGAPIIF